MSRRSSSGAGCGIVVIGGFLWWVYTVSPPAFWVSVVIGVLVIILVAFFSRPATCDICGNVIRKQSYSWTIDGANKRVCPKCNNRLESRKSKSAVDDLLDS